MDVKKNAVKKPQGVSENPIIAIIGGGAAGLMAAYFAKLGNSEAEVILIEKNTYLGAKVIISGGGRCNVTTGLQDVSEVLKNYPRGADFLRTAIQAFPPAGVMSWFESQGVALKTEPDLRVFPKSNDGKDIVGALENALKELGVKLLLNQQITELLNQKGSEKFVIKFKSRDDLIADKVILTTGGNAYRHTGSSGDGYAFAKEMGHLITPLAPSLASLHTAEHWPKDLSGISFQKAGLTFISADQERQYHRTGPFLFTHKGLSGPAIFAISGYAAFEKFHENLAAKILIDLFPDQTTEELSKELDQKILANPNKKIDNFLALFLPHSMAEKVTNYLLGTQFLQITATHLSKPMRQKIVSVLKGLELHIMGRGAGDEFVTAGGVALTEVDPRTMESKLRRGLYFAGELLDIDGFTGGFNLQASWATGALAGESAAQVEQ